MSSKKTERATSRAIQPALQEVIFIARNDRDAGYWRTMPMRYTALISLFLWISGFASSAPQTRSYPGVFRVRVMARLGGVDEKAGPFKLEETEGLLLGTGSAVGIGVCILTAKHNCELLNGAKKSAIPLGKIYVENGKEITSIDPASIRPLGDKDLPEDDLCVAKMTSPLQGAYDESILAEGLPVADLFKDPTQVKDYDSIKKAGVKMTTVGYGGQPSITKEEEKILTSKASERKVNLLFELSKRPFRQIEGPVYFAGNTKGLLEYLEKHSSEIRKASDERKDLGAFLIAAIAEKDLQTLKEIAQGENGLVCAHKERPVVKGDSGGGLFYEDEHGKKHLVGIVSRKDDETSDLYQKYSFYAPVPRHLHWIKKQLYDLKCL